MSISDLKAYTHSVNTDAEVRAAAIAIGKSDVQGQIEFAKTLGYTFSKDDMVVLAREQNRTNPANDELTEAELASVSGGFFLFTELEQMAREAGW